VGRIGKGLRRLAPAAYGTRGAPFTAAGDWDPGYVPGEGVAAQLAMAQAARAVPLVATRGQAMANSVVNRARDIVCGVLASLPIQVTRDRAGVTEELDPGWLSRPDPLHSRGWFVSWVTDDLFFHGHAAARITVEDPAQRAVALQWMPWDQLEANLDGTVLTWRRGWYPDPFTPQTGLADVTVRAADVVLWESPLVGLLNGGETALTTSSQLDRAANKFAGAELAAGWLKQMGGEPIDDANADALVLRWATSRALNAIGFLNETLDYRESELDPSRLQLVEGRSYQDAQTARLCNMPNWTVGVGVPGDSMTYKTALTARLDLLDFGLEPFVSCWSEALSQDKVTPHGTTVSFDLEPFLRTAQLGAVAATRIETPTPTPAGSPANA
jgi:hypothetical protein